MSINKEYLRKKVVQAIEQMPYEVTIYRQNLNAYREITGYIKVISLVGILYTDSKNKAEVSLSDKGEVDTPTTKNFLVDYNDNSILVKKDDFLFYKNQCWKVMSQGEEFEVYFEMVVEEHEWIEV